MDDGDLSENHRPSGVLLVADDDDDDYALTQQALETVGYTGKFLRVEDGEALLHYLHRRGVYADPAASPVPSLILLDFNMPRLDGLGALKAIKSDPALRHIPVVMLSTSAVKGDIGPCYDNGANAFLRKPLRFAALVNLLRCTLEFWLGAAEPAVQSEEAHRR